MKKPLLIDLFCGQGGAAQGYINAGFEVIGVDIANIRNYPAEFIRNEWNAREILTLIEQSTAIHASPPCKAYSRLKAQASTANREITLIDIVRDTITPTGKPLIIENVPGAPVRKDVVLNGQMFGLPILRERWFELQNWYMFVHSLPTKKGSVKTGELLSIAGNGGYSKKETARTINRPPVWTTGSATEDRKHALGIDWMTSRGLSQAIPPAYTQYIGRALFNHLTKTD